MKGLYDIFKYVFLRFLREFEKWSLLGKIGKNEEKMRKMSVPESPIIHYSHLPSLRTHLELSLKMMNTPR